MKLLLTFLIAHVFAHSQSPMTIVLKEKPEPLKTKKYEELILSESCFKSGKPQCQAYQVSLKKVPSSLPKTSMAPHPAAHYCQDVGGNNRIAKDATGAQYDYCLFKDGSLIDSWSLYNKHHALQVIK